MKNRQKDEIIRHILTVCNGIEGKGIARIMLHAYITHQQAKSYLAELVDKGLIENNTFSSKFYRTSSKGIEYLAALDRMSELLPIETRRGVRKEDSILGIPAF